MVVCCTNNGVVLVVAVRTVVQIPRYFLNYSPPNLQSRKVVSLGFMLLFYQLVWLSWPTHHSLNFRFLANLASILRASIFQRHHLALSISIYPALPYALPVNPNLCQSSLTTYHLAAVLTVKLHSPPLLPPSLSLGVTCQNQIWRLKRQKADTRI